MRTPGPDGCAPWAATLHGFIDGELDAANTLAFEAHLAACPHCRAEVERFTSSRRTMGQEGVAWPVPEHVRAQVVEAVAQMSARPKRDPRRQTTQVLGFVRRWSFVPSAAVLAAGLFLVLAVPHSSSSLQDEIVASHVRSLLVDHLTDVQTSDRHTVKPWFNGKADVSPPVIDLAAQGFPLIGGRLDYIAGRPVPVVVYRRHGHVINVFVWPARETAAQTYSERGYNMVWWTSNGFTFCAVSDVADADLLQLRQDFLQAEAQ
ncbi:anti-sigma factor family protein [Methylobacterium sp. J-070]|uniref:anti-sigma factor family protein n=1 Tax=Methylobacterium sp. J-070 TaxID=2836650 RepID=UPI001FB8C0E7|nr:anti-sigma factor [Methylobacterium sp. J-070]MCJ2050341.1 anti-sigma factor [Methylobacterium sp. J-070]